MANERALVVDLHIPYCIRPERYSAAFGAVGTNAQKDAYLRALQREIRAWEGELDGYVVRAVRLGGGSASVMSPDLLGETLSLLRRTLPMAPGAEVSYDALPNTIGTPSLTGIASGHPTRVELMVRSIHDDELSALGCPFTAQDVRNAMLFLGRFHVNNIGMTIHYGIPGQTDVSWHNTLHACAIMRPAHILVEPLAVTGAEGMPSDDARYAMYAHACEFLRASGYIHYAAGHFCLPGHEYLFDALRLNGTPFVGMGVNALSLLEGVMTRNTNNLPLYVKNAGDFEKQTAQILPLSPEQLMEEYVLGRLRLTQGLLHSLFEARFAQPVPEGLTRQLEAMAEAGWLEVTPEGYLPTTQGLFAAQNGRVEIHIACQP